MTHALPPVVQVFELNATEFAAGANGMVAEMDRAAVSIDQTAAATDRLAVAADKAGAADERIAAEAGQTAAGADEAAAGLDREAAAADRAAVASGRFGAANGRLREANGRYVASTDEAVAGTDRETGALGRQGKAAEGSTGKMAALGSVMKTVGVALGGAMIYGVVQAAKFQQEVTKLYTAAGLTGASMKTVSAEILKVGSATGYTGTQIAEALYHPVSAGLNLKTALAAVAEGAKLAQIHGANLDDTMYALSSVMKAFNQNAGDAGKTAALLNSIVGQGDMRFQDFNQSVKNWAPTAASMGISIQSMGAGLAYLTDRGNSAEVASTRLTMGLSMVTAGSKAANTYLKDLGLTSGDVTLKNQSLAATMNKAGLTTNKIAADLKKPDGLYVALHDLQGAFHKSGLSAAQADQVMAKLFGGGRSDKAILSLMSNLDGVKQKYEDIGKGVSHYGNSWAKTQETVSFQWKKAVADVKNLATSFGVILLPPVEKILSALGKFFQIIQANPVLRILAGAIIAVAVALGIASAAMTVFNFELLASPVFWIIIAVIALVAALYELYKHCKTVRDAVHDVAVVFKSAWATAMRAAGAVVHWFVTGPLAFIKQQMKVFAAFWHSHGAQIEQIAKQVWSQISAVITLAWTVISAILRTGLVILQAVWNVAWAVIHDTVVTVWHVIADVIRTAIHVILDVIGIVLDLITGKWGKAWNDLKKLASDALHGAINIIKDVVSGFGTLLWDAGKALINGLINGIKSMFGALGSVASGIGHFIASLKGPLPDDEILLVPHGQAIMRGLMTGMGSQMPALRNQVGQVTAALTPGGGGGLAIPGGGYGATGGGGTTIGPIHLTINGFIGNQSELLQQLYLMFQQATLQNNRRNATNGLTLAHP